MSLRQIFNKLRRDKANSGSEGAAKSSLPNSPTTIDTNEHDGLFPLNVPVATSLNAADNYEIDIVFVHGLDGHHSRTWTHPSTKFFWPRELADTLPGARVFFYGYPSQKWASQTTMSIRNFATDLLKRVMLVREDNESLRSVLFICHSLGGIVVKQALVLASQDPQFERVQLCVKAVVFLGTPHGGSAIARSGELLGSVANAVSGGLASINTALLQVLFSDSQILEGISEDFINPSTSLRILSVFETKKHPWIHKLIVEKSSAVLKLHNETRLGMDAYHQDICRFKSPEDQQYQLLSREIESLAKGILAEHQKARGGSISTNRSLDEVEKMCASLLNTVDMAGYESSLDARIDGTLDWISSSSQYVEWVSSPESKILWVNGGPGSGKTTMALYIMQCLREKLKSGSILARFLCNNKIENYRDGCHILRSLIFQIVSQRRRLWLYVRKASDVGGFQIFQQFSALWNILVQLVQTEELSVTIIVDAIDECEQKTQAMILHCLFDLVRLQKRAPVKFFITSRFRASDIRYSLSHLLFLSLDDRRAEVTRDIHLVIHHRLERLVERGACMPSVRDSLEKILVDKADATFLWIKLALPSLESRRALLASDVLDFKRNVPAGLESLYSDLLSAIPEKDRPLAGNILRLIVASDRPLSSEEISILLSVKPEIRSASEFTVEAQVVDDGLIQAVLKPLVRIEGGAVYLVHQSFKDYLVSLADAAFSSLNPEFAVDLAYQKGSLALACLRYLSLREFCQHVSFTDESWHKPHDSDAIESSDDENTLYGFDLFREPVIDDLLIDEKLWNRYRARYRLFDYAALHWVDHILVAGDSASEESSKLAIAIFTVEADHPALWFRYYWFRKMQPEPLPAAVDPLMVASFFGYTQAARFLLKSANNDPSSTSLALYWAARRGHVDCLKVILQSADALLSKLVFRHHPVSAAAQYGRVDCLSILLHYEEMNVNVQDKVGKTPLALAAAASHISTMDILLQQPSLDFNLSDHTESGPLHWAVASESAPAISRLLEDPRLDKDSKDMHGRNVLSWAAESGNPAIVRLLLEHPSISINNADKTGRTPLSHASQYGHLEAVKLLVQAPGVDSLLADKSGRTPHSWAAAQRHTSVLIHLLSCAPTAADSPDTNGWTPLAWSLDPPGYVENALALLLRADVDNNRRDSVYGRCVLAWVAGYGYEPLVREMLRLKGLDVDARDYYGRTPLMDAAVAGNAKIITSLLETGRVDVNSRDTNGRTPLAWAARGGHAEAVAVLLEVSGVDVVIGDQDGLRPVDVARMLGHESVIALLEDKPGAV